MSAGLLIRADGGPKIGAGHLGRCLALAEAWRDRGGDVTLMSEALPGAWATRYTAEGVSVRAVADGWLDTGAAWVVVDGYGLAPFERAAREAGHRVLAVDDFAIGGPHHVDLVVDQNLDVDADAYPGFSSLLGPRYALLRREFRMRAAMREAPAVAERLLIALGGFPSGAGVQLVDKTLALAALTFSVEHLQGRDDVAVAMAGADIALAASGSSAWELCCMGVPAVLVSVAPNQRRVAEALARRGLADDAGPVETCDPGALAAALDALAGDQGKRQAIADGGMRLVDGRGPGRVVTRLLAEVLRLRPAVEEDCRLLWEWVNDTEVRRRAFSTAPIPWETHTEWFGARLRDPACRIWIATDPEGDPIGQVRFQQEGAEAEIAVSVVTTARGRGWGAPLIDAGVRRLFAETDVASVLARVKPDNEASVRAFEAASFEPDGEGSGGGNTWLRYARGRDVRGR